MATNTINSAGGADYTSWQAWEDDLPATLTEAEIGQGVNEEISSAGRILTIAGHTTTPIFTITVTAEAGASFVDNASIETNAFKYNSANGACMLATGAYGGNGVIEIDDDNIFVSRLMVKANHATQGFSFIMNNVNIVDVDQCIFEHTATNNAFTIRGSGSKVRNSLIVQRRSAAAVIMDLSSGPQLFNCTLVVPANLTAATNAINGAYSTTVVQNCAIFGATNVGTGSTTFAFTTCQVDDATPPTGCTTQTYADQFEDDEDDWRLKTGADCIDAGTMAGESKVSANGVVRQDVLVPDVLELSTNHSAGAITDIDENPSNPDANYMTWDGNGNTVTEVSFPSPAVDLTTGADLQEFRVWLREDTGSGSNTPTWDLSLYEFEGGTSNLISSLATGSDPLTGAMARGTFNASSLTTISGANVRLRLTQTAGGSGGPSTRRGIEVGACEWNTAIEAMDVGCWEFVAPAGGGMAWPSPTKQMAHLLLR